MSGCDVGGERDAVEVRCEASVDGPRRAGGAAGPAFLVMVVAILGWMAVRQREVRDDRAPVPIESSRVDLNQASAAELALLPEIGPSMAETIIADRLARGSFASVDDLGRVRGVGPATIAALKPHATVGDHAQRAGGG